jgi:hypothetical protein
MAVKDTQGRWLDPVGDPIPPKYIDMPVKKRDRMVERLAKQAAKISEQITSYRRKVEADVEAYLVDLDKTYGINARTKAGNKILSNFSNTVKLEVRRVKFLAFDERLALAKALIDDCIRRWSAGADDKIMLLVNDAFKVDKKGNIDRDRVLSLRKLKIKDKDWKKAMHIIAESMVVVSARTYLSVSVKDKDGRWRNVPLDIADV